MNTYNPDTLNNIANQKKDETKESHFTKPPEPIFNPQIIHKE